MIVTQINDANIKDDKLFFLSLDFSFSIDWIKKICRECSTRTGRPLKYDWLTYTYRKRFIHKTRSDGYQSYWRRADPHAFNFFSHLNVQFTAFHIILNSALSSLETKLNRNWFLFHSAGLLLVLLFWVLIEYLDVIYHINKAESNILKSNYQLLRFKIRNFNFKHKKNTYKWIATWLCVNIVLIYLVEYQIYLLNLNSK